MRYYIPKEGVIMAEALGQELLIDLYSCDEDAISSATAVQESVATAFDLAEMCIRDSIITKSNAHTLILNS